MLNYSQRNNLADFMSLTVLRKINYIVLANFLFCFYLIIIKVAIKVNRCLRFSDSSSLPDIWSMCAKVKILFFTIIYLQSFSNVITLCRTKEINYCLLLNFSLFCDLYCHHGDSLLMFSPTGIS